MAPDSKLATVLNEISGVCATRKVFKEWQEFEEYMYACLSGFQYQPGGPLPPVATPGEDGYISFPKWVERCYTSYKTLIKCLRELKARIEEANPGDACAHVLVSLELRPSGLLYIYIANCHRESLQGNFDLRERVKKACQAYRTDYHRGKKQRAEAVRYGSC